MATQLAIVNRVLRRLREDQVTSVGDSDYAMLVAEFLNDTLREVAQTHMWENWKSWVTTPTVANTATYSLSSSINNDSELLRDSMDRPMAYITTTSEPYRMMLDDYDVLEAKEKESTVNPQTGEPYTFGISDRTLRLWLVPDAVYSVETKWYIPQIDLEVDGTDDGTDITIPSQPLWLGTLYLAMNERGEEIGEPGGVLERRYYEALSNAVARDGNFKMLTNNYEGYRD